MPTDSYKSFHQARESYRDSVVEAVAQRLKARPPVPPNESQDNTLFAPLGAATDWLLNKAGDSRLAIDLFHQCFELALAYENEHGCKVHKGSTMFNVGLAYLDENDFASAMHWFEISEEETHETRKDNSWRLLETELFKKNFWSGVQRYEDSHPLTIYEELWGNKYGEDQASDDWSALSDESLLGFISVNAQRVARSRLQQPSGAPRTEGAALADWGLLSDLCRILETELTARGVQGPGLLSKVLRNPDGPLVGLKAEANRQHDDLRKRCKNGLAARFPELRSTVLNRGALRMQRCAAAALLAGEVRNVVQHGVDKSSVLFKNASAARFSIGLLLSLCHLDGWAPPLAS